MIPAGAALLGLLLATGTIHSEGLLTDPAVEAKFRGCDSAGWCRFSVESPDPAARLPHRVRPDGVSWVRSEGTISVAVRDRLNALLASMIHQHKQIILHDLRELDDGTFAAAVTVNGANVALDPILVELRSDVTGMPR